MGWRRVVVTTIAAVLVFAAGFSKAGAVVWCQGDELGDEKARSRSARTAQRIYEASGDAFRMLGFLEVVKLDPRAQAGALYSHAETYAKLGETRELLTQALEDKAFLAAADKVILGVAPDALRVRLEKAGLPSNYPPLQKTIDEAVKVGSKVIFERCRKEIDDARAETEKFKEFIRERGRPDRMWFYIRMWNSLIATGRGAAALFYP